MAYQGGREADSYLESLTQGQVLMIDLRAAAYVLAESDCTLFPVFSTAD